MFLGYVVLQRSCIYNLCYMWCYFAREICLVVYFYISTFRSICVVPNMAVFYSSLVSCLPSMLLRYCLNDFELLLLLLFYACTAFFQEPWPNRETDDENDDDNGHYLSILRKINLNQQGTMLCFVVYVRRIVSLVPIVFHSCSVVLETKGAAWQTEVNAVQILFYAFLKKKNTKGKYSERV